MPKSTMFVRLFLLGLVILASGARTGAQLPGLPPLPVPPPIPIPIPGAILGKLDPLLQQRVPGFTGRSKVIVRATSVTSIGPVRMLVQQLGGRKAAVSASPRRTRSSRTTAVPSRWSRSPGTEPRCG